MEAFVGVIILVFGGHVYGTDSAVFPSEENCRIGTAAGVANGNESGVIKPGSVVTVECIKVAVKTEASEKKPPSTSL